MLVMVVSEVVGVVEEMCIVLLVVVVVVVAVVVVVDVSTSLNDSETRIPPVSPCSSLLFLSSSLLTSLSVSFLPLPPPPCFYFIIFFFYVELFTSTHFSPL